MHSFSFTETKAAGCAASMVKKSDQTASMVKKSDRTVRRWRSALINNDGVLPELEQGRYQRSGVLWQNEELNKKREEHDRTHADKYSVHPLLFAKVSS